MRSAVPGQWNDYSGVARAAGWNCTYVRGSGASQTDFTADAHELKARCRC